MSEPVLYSYFRSSSSWRVRIALNLKGIKYKYNAINLLKGEQLSDEYKKVNPLGFVPALSIDGTILTESLSIIEYLEETHPETPLLPKAAADRAKVRQLAMMIACDIQPVQNFKVLKYRGMEHKMEWGCWAITEGFIALEKALSQTAGKYCFGDSVTLADLCLVPQVYNANRFKVDMSKFPIISRVSAELDTLEAFKQTHPSAQPDCPEDLK